MTEAYRYAYARTLVDTPAHPDGPSATTAVTTVRGEEEPPLPYQERITMALYDLTTAWLERPGPS